MGKKKPLRNSHGRGKADIAIGRGRIVRLSVFDDDYQQCD
jgi:hypothetical protein